MDIPKWIVILFLIWIVFFVLKNREENKKKVTQKAKENPLKSTEYNGYIYFDKDKILSSEEFARMQTQFKLEDKVNMVAVLKDFMIPYSATEYYKIQKALRDLSEPHRSTVEACYKQNITASAILFKIPIPKNLFCDNVVVLLYCSLYLKLTQAVDYDSQMQTYIREEYHTVESDKVIKHHQDLQILLKSLDSVNTLLGPMIPDFEHYLTIEHLYNCWLKLLVNKKPYLDYYSESIVNFKELVTLYYGIAKLDCPMTYLNFNPAIIDYILQSKRYSKSRLSLAVCNTVDMV